ncbi:MAG: orotidine-5'-phosphate decarboxylase [Euryarchaeota archaeon]|nr:orotidine-5'-phosphate decarboxylase [Euryarchaeota archaeon]
MSRLILALDVLDREKAMNIAKRVAPHVHAIKVGWPLVMNTGIEVVSEISRYAPVICDFKVADIPNTTRLIVRTARENGASGIIVHSFVGHDSVEAAVAEAGDMSVYVVTEMSHPGALDFMQSVTNRMIEIAKNAGAKGIIAPATRPERLREIRKIAGELEILSPGVGAQGGKAKDAIEAGADYIIVGRRIYNAEDPEKEAMAINKEIEKE